jgi:membrane associated rhomboid family serine protease
MFSSIWEDFKYQISRGTRLNQVILINVTAFVLILLVRVGFNMTQGVNATGFGSATDLLSLHTNLKYILSHPWILITHMFVHITVMHILWNMLMLYWFGNIVGDLLGDRMIWSVYLTSGLMGALTIIFFSRVFNYPSGEVIAYGASAAVMGFILVATIIAPDYILHLLLIGEVRLKFVALVVILIDLVGLAENNNTGGHIGHLGGAAGGALFVWFIRQGWTLPTWNKKKEPAKVIPIRRAVATPSPVKKVPVSGVSNTITKPQSEIDRILDKISAKGINSLTQEEKKTLEDAGKK